MDSDTFWSIILLIIVVITAIGVAMWTVGIEV